MELTANKVIPSCVFNDEITHTEFMLFPVCLVFNNTNNVVERYSLNERYGDFINFPANRLPKEITENQDILIKEDGMIEFISLRAMHRIVFSDISVDNFHFFINNGLRRIILDYDKLHGNFFSYLINKEQYPKNIFTIRVHLTNNNDIAIGAIDHIEEVFSFDTHKGGFLAYCHDLENGKNYTFYIDNTNSDAIELVYSGIDSTEASETKESDNDGEI